MTTILAEYGSFMVSSSDTALRKRTASSCQPEVTTIWFPVLPGTTELPVSPEPVINETPEAPNSVAAPIDFDPENPDLCALFNDILPISSPPIYPVEQTVELLSAPYIETVLVPTITRARLGVTSIDYPLSVEGGSVSLPTKTRLGLVNLYIAAENAIFALTGNDAILSRRKDIFPVLGYFFSSVTEASLVVRSYMAVFVPAVGFSIQTPKTRTIPSTDKELDILTSSITIEGLPCQVLRPVIIEIPSPTLITISTATPSVVIGSAIIPPAPVAIALSALAPSIITGASVSLPYIYIAVSGLPPIQAGAALTTILPSSVNISIDRQLPIVSGGSSSAVPASQIGISSHLPEISIFTVEVFVPTTGIAIAAMNPSTALSVPSTGISIVLHVPSRAGADPLPEIEDILRIGTVAPGLGSTGAVFPPTGWDVVSDDSWDDEPFQISNWQFAFTLDSVAYTSTFVGSNTYLTFGAESYEYGPFGASSPYIRKILFGAADNSSQRIFSKAEMVLGGLKIQRIRYEGTGTNTGTPGSPDIVAEFTFFQPFPDGRQMVEARFGVHSTTTGPFMIASEEFALASDTITPNSSWVFIGNSSGTTWTLTSNRFVTLKAPKKVLVPSTGITVSSSIPEIYLYAMRPPAAIVNISTIAPSLNTNIAVIISVTDLVISSKVPFIVMEDYFASMITQVYTWEREFVVDWWAD